MAGRSAGGLCNGKEFKGYAPSQFLKSVLGAYGLRVKQLDKAAVLYGLGSAYSSLGQSRKILSAPALSMQAAM